MDSVSHDISPQQFLKFQKVEFVANNEIQCLSCGDDPMKVWENRFRKPCWLAGSAISATVWGSCETGFAKVYDMVNC